MLLAAAAFSALAGCGSTGARSSSTAAGIPRQLLAQSRPIGRGPRFHPPATGPVIGRCRPSLGRRYGAHVEVFASNRVMIVPAALGTRPPLRFSEGRISSAGCYGSLVTLEPTGLVLIRPGLTLSLSELFRAWGQPLSRRRLAQFSAPHGSQVAVFLDGRRWRHAPGSVLLTRHAEIVLEVGPYVPPHRVYAFPDGL